MFAWACTFETSFQSTRPRGARQRSNVTNSGFQRISIHAPTRGATLKSLISDIKRVFQSTRPRGARLLCHRVELLEQTDFNPRAHEGRDDSAMPSSSGPFSFQSTRPRGARPSRSPSRSASTKISIHAPTRGATLP